MAESSAQRQGTARLDGEWVRRMRLERGWSVQQMVRELREAARLAGDRLPDKEIMIVMIYRWESGRSGISERYRLRYCSAFKVPADCFGDPSLVYRDGLSRRRMHAGLSKVADAEKRDQMCFTLGYVAALMTAAKPGQQEPGTCGELPQHVSLLGSGQAELLRRI